MKAHIERDWSTANVKVWLYQPGPSRTIQVVGVDETGHLLLQNFDEGQQMPPSFILPAVALEALVKEASGIIPPSEATVDAMRDARETRDRLLAMVERTVEVWTSPQIKRTP